MTEWRLFALATALAWMHLADEFLFAGERPLGALEAGVLNAGAAVFYPRLGRWRALPAIFFAWVWIGGGLAHVSRLVTRGPGPADYTGIAELVGGVLFAGVGLAVIVGMRKRG